jgi:hypothetical protein
MTSPATRADDPLTQLIGATIDRLVNLDVSGYGVIGRLYEAAVARQGGPLTLRAAARLVEAVGADHHVFLTGGWILPGYLAHGENDGPIGCAALARALSFGLHARPIVLTEERLVPNVEATCRAAGLLVYDVAELCQITATAVPGVSVLPFPIDDAAASTEAERLVREYAPRAVIAIEKNGPNRLGVYHMVGGTDNSANVAKVGRLFEAAQRLGILTIGIGDRGNEIGFAVIHDVVAGLLPFGTTCRCPCGAGVADNTAVDVLVTSCVSNWGAYGIAACLAELLQNPELLHTPETEAQLIQACAQAGGFDGMSGRPVFAMDGMRGEVSVAIVELLREIIAAPASRKPAKMSTPLYAKR